MAMWTLDYIRQLDEVFTSVNERSLVDSRTKKPYGCIDTVSPGSKAEEIVVSNMTIFYQRLYFHVPSIHPYVRSLTFLINVFSKTKSDSN